MERQGLCTGPAAPCSVRHDEILRLLRGSLNAECIPLVNIRKPKRCQWLVSEF